MMHIILCLLVLDFLHFQAVTSERISSKLDFGEDDHSAARIITVTSPERLTNLEILKPEGATVICSATGCNKTENKQDDIVSDVLVHVKTSVNVPKAKNETIEQIPDVPVVLGYGRNNQQFSTDIGYGRNSQPFYPGGLVNSNPVVVGNVENSFPETGFVQVAEPKFQHRQPPRKFYSPNYKQVSYDTNLLYVPYLEPSSHNYHFGEQPPSQYVWTPKGGASFNPVEFKGFERPAWNSGQWKPVGSHPQQRTTNGYTTCTCNNPGLNWYPTTPTWNLQSRGLQPQPHIDDKLAPLN